MKNVLTKHKLNPEDWQYMGRWVAPVLESDLWTTVYETLPAQKIFISETNSNCIIIDGHFYFWKDFHERVVEEAYNKIKNGDYKYFENIYKVIDISINAALDTGKYFDSSPKFDIEKIKNFDKILRELKGAWQTIFPIGEALELYIKEECSKYGLNLDDLLYCFKPVKTPWLYKQHDQVGKFAEFFKENNLLSWLNSKNRTQIRLRLKEKYPHLLKAMEAHLAEFAWVGVHHFWGEKLDWDKLIEEIINYQASPKQNKQENHNLPDSLQKNIEIINNITYFRLHCAEVNDKVVFSAIPHLEILAEKVGLKYEEMYWFCFQELFAAYDNGKILDRELVFERESSNAFLYIDGDLVIISGKEVEALKKIFLASDSQNIKSFKGNIACKGLAQGKVRIVLGPKQVLKFEHNEILVSPETTPDFVPAMKKAVAIITDQGGVTSHAAIVSRELGKPCIIGTKIATQVLKDGDLVEVDADKGIVKRI